MNDFNDLNNQKKKISFAAPTPSISREEVLRLGQEEQRRAAVRNERDANQPSDMGFDMGRMGANTRKLFENRTPHSFHSYRKVSEPNYKNYPGGFEGARQEALTYRKKNKEDFSDTGDLALAPRLQYDWTIDRKNPVYISESNHPKDTSQQFTAGTAWIDQLRDKKYDADYTAIHISPKGVNRQGGHPDDILAMFDEQVKRGIPTKHVLHEELVHSTQNPGGANFRDREGRFGEKGSLLPYAARNAEMGAKLTGEKQKYIRNRWGLQEGSPGGRSGSFTEDDAESIMNQLIEGGYSEDFGLRNFSKTREGKEYLQNNKDEFIQFMMSTASNEPRKHKPGLFTGNNKRYA
jgi:hypothetical protein